MRLSWWPPSWESAKVQVVLLGLVCFCVPGAWNSITSMAGGLEDTSTTSAAVAALYACFALSSLAAPAVANRVGPRLTLFYGTIGYILYVLALLAAASSEAFRTGPAAKPVIVASGAVNGVCAGLLWTAQGQVIMAYPSDAFKGRYQALFWAIFNMGAVIGGLITFASNVDDDGTAHAQQHAGAHAAGGAHAASPATFAAFLAMMVAGACVALAMRDPSRRAVVRPDTRARVALAPLPDWRGEARATLALFRDARLVALVPLFLYSNFFYTFQFGGFNHRLFDVRSEGLNNVFYWGAQMAGAYLIGGYLDSSSSAGGGGPRRRAVRSFAGVAALVAASWALAGAGVGGLDAPPRAMDYSGSGAGDRGVFWTAWATYFMWGWCDAFVQCWAYWLMSQLPSPAAAAGANAAANAADGAGGGASRAAVLARYAGFYKCVQSVGAACAWGIDSAGAKASAQFNLNVALAAVCVLPTLWVARQLPASAAANDAVADEEGADAPLTSPTSPGDLELARL